MTAFISLGYNADLYERIILPKMLTVILCIAHLKAEFTKSVSLILNSACMVMIACFGLNDLSSWGSFIGFIDNVLKKCQIILRYFR